MDTRFFEEDFKTKLLASIDDFDEQCEGLLVHSDNFQALNLLEAKYRDRVKCVYIDPPYNTGEREFAYKDNYRHSSWLTMMRDRMLISKELVSHGSSFAVSINEEELFNLKLLMDEVKGSEHYITTITVKVRHDGRILKGDKDIHETTEHLVVYRNDHDFNPGKRILDNTSLEQYIWTVKIVGGPFETRMMGNKLVEVYSPDHFRLIRTDSDESSLKRINIRGSLRTGNSSGRFYVANIEPLFDGYRGFLFKVPDMGNDAFYNHRYFFIPGRMSKRKNGDYFQGVPVDRKDTKSVPYPNHWDIEPNFWDYEKEFNKVGYEGSVDFRHGKKPMAFIEKYFHVAGVKDDAQSIVLDYFAGSGTTGHAVINLNRQDCGRRKYILVEMGEYFDTFTKSRIQKAVYSKDWRNRENVSPGGLSHCFKYIRLESYEDTLNNLVLKPRSKQRRELLEENPTLREDYMLGYWLDVETNNSPSLLNIEQFEDPFKYNLKVADGNAGVVKSTCVDLVETFNYLIGLNIKHIATVDGFKTVTGINPERESVLVVWRNIKKKNNADLEKFLGESGWNPKDTEYDRIYVNGDHALDDPFSKVKMIEIEFQRLMFDC